MFTLAAGNTLAGVAASATTINYLIVGMELSANVETYKVLAQGQLASSAGTLYTTPASTETFVKSIHLVNTSASDVAGIKLFKNGTAASNQVTGSLTIPANGWATYTEDGWKVFNSSGEQLMNGVTASGGGGSGAGSPLVRFNYLFSNANTTDSDPGTGKFKYSDATASQVTLTLYVSNTDNNGNDRSSYFASLVAGDPGSSPSVTIYSSWANTTASRTKRMQARITSVTAGVGYYKLGVDVYWRDDASPLWANNDSLQMQFDGTGKFADLGPIGQANSNISQIYGLPNFIMLRTKLFSLNANEAVLYPFMLRRPTWFFNMRVQVTTNNGGGNTRGMIYKMAQRNNDGLSDSGTIVADSGLQTNNFASTGVKNFAFNSGTGLWLPPGYYYGILANGAGSGGVVRGVCGVQENMPGLALPISTNAWMYAKYWRYTSDLTSAPTTLSGVPSFVQNNVNDTDIDGLLQEVPFIFTMEPV